MKQERGTLRRGRVRRVHSMRRAAAHSCLSPALGLYSYRESDQMIRPHGTQSDTLLNDFMVQSGDRGAGEGVGEKGRAVSGQKTLCQTSQQERDDHQRHHVPFQKWCSHCIQGKCGSGAHKWGEIRGGIPGGDTSGIVGLRAPEIQETQMGKAGLISHIGRNRYDTQMVLSTFGTLKGRDSHAAKLVSRETG